MEWAAQAGWWPFAQVAQSADVAALRAVLRQMVDLGGTVFDTAPAYGASEEVAGRIAQELGIAKELFWATKLNVAGWDRGAADPDAARKQLETSFRRIGKAVIDLVQVHNMGAATGRPPDAAMRKRMIQLVEALP